MEKKLKITLTGGENLVQLKKKTKLCLRGTLHGTGTGDCGRPLQRCVEVETLEGHNPPPPPLGATWGAPPQHDGAEPAEPQTLFFLGIFSYKRWFLGIYLDRIEVITFFFTVWKQAHTKWCHLAANFNATIVFRLQSTVLTKVSRTKYRWGLWRGKKILLYFYFIGGSERQAGTF